MDNIYLYIKKEFLIFLMHRITAFDIRAPKTPAPVLAPGRYRNQQGLPENSRNIYIQIVCDKPAFDIDKYVNVDYLIDQVKNGAWNYIVTRNLVDETKYDREDLMLTFSDVILQDDLKLMYIWQELNKYPVMKAYFKK